MTTSFTTANYIQFQFKDKITSGSYFLTSAKNQVKLTSQSNALDATKWSVRAVLDSNGGTLSNSGAIVIFPYENPGLALKWTTPTLPTPKNIPTQGTVTLVPFNPEDSFYWKLDGRKGSFGIQPFNSSANSVEMNIDGKFKENAPVGLYSKPDGYVWNIYND